jgi:hypothetical protein
MSLSEIVQVSAQLISHANRIIKTPRSRFINSVNTVAFVFDFLEDVCYWKKPIKSLAVLVAFTVGCLYPRLFVLLLCFQALISRYNKYQRAEIAGVGTIDHMKKLNQLLKLTYKMTEITDSKHFTGTLLFIIILMQLFLKFNLQLLLFGYFVILFKPFQYLCRWASTNSFHINSGVVLMVVRFICFKLVLHSDTSPRLSKSPPVPLLSSPDKFHSDVVVFMKLVEFERYWFGIGWAKHLLPDETVPLYYLTCDELGLTVRFESNTAITEFLHTNLTREGLFDFQVIDCCQNWNYCDNSWAFNGFTETWKSYTRYREFILECRFK